MRLQEQRDIIQAAIDGRRIEIKSRVSCDQQWRETYYTVFNFAQFDYRLKPAPREFFLNVYAGERSHIAHESEASANRDALASRSECIRVREVVE